MPWSARCIGGAEAEPRLSSVQHMGRAHRQRALQHPRESMADCIQAPQGRDWPAAFVGTTQLVLGSRDGLHKTSLQLKLTPPWILDFRVSPGVERKAHHLLQAYHVKL